MPMNSTLYVMKSKLRKFTAEADSNIMSYTQPFYGFLVFVQDNPGEQVPEETFTHSHLLWSLV